jgi:hypothetical protein
VTVCAPDAGVAKLTLDELRFSGGATPIRIFAIMPPSSCERIWQCNRNVPTIIGSVKSSRSFTLPGPLAVAAGTLTLSMRNSCDCAVPLTASTKK